MARLGDPFPLGGGGYRSPLRRWVIIFLMLAGLGGMAYIAHRPIQQVYWAVYARVKPMMSEADLIRLGKELPAGGWGHWPWRPGRACGSLGACCGACSPGGPPAAPPHLATAVTKPVKSRELDQTAPADAVKEEAAPAVVKEEALPAVVLATESPAPATTAAAAGGGAGGVVVPAGGGGDAAPTATDSGSLAEKYKLSK